MGLKGAAPSARAVAGPSAPASLAFMRVPGTSTDWLLPMGFSWQGTGNANAQNNGIKDVAYPCFLPFPGRITAVGTYCSTGEAGALMRCGIFAPTQRMRPSRLIADLGTLNGDTVGTKSIACNVPMPAGIFMLVSSSSTHTTVRWIGASANGTPPYGGGITNTTGGGCVGKNTGDVGGFTGWSPNAATFNAVGALPALFFQYVPDDGWELR